MKRSTNIISIIVIFISILYKYLSSYEIENEIVTRAIIILAIILNSIIILRRKFQKKQLLIVAISFILVLLMTYISKSLDFVIALLIALMFYKDNLREFFKIFFISSLSCYLLTIFLNLVGVLENHAIRRFTEDGIIIRNSLGFSHVNGVFKNFLPIVLSGYFLVKEKNIRKYNLLVFIISTILYIISNSRTGYISILIYLILTSFVDVMKYQVVNKSVRYMFLICTIITFIIIVVGGKSVNNPLNELFSNRPIIWNQHINQPGALSIIKSGTTIHMDNTYLTYLINFGISIFLFIFLIKYFAIKKIQDHRLLIIILVLSIYGIFENGVSYNIDFSLIIQFIYLFSFEIGKTENMNIGDEKDIYEKR